MWTGAPASIHLVQGETQIIPFAFSDADGDPITEAIHVGAIEEESDSTSATLHASFDAPAADTLTVALDDGRGQTADYTVPITIDPIAWKNDLKWTGSAGPIAREHGTFLIDEAARSAMLIGGSGYSPQGTALADFWKLDLGAGTWTAVTPTGDAFPPTASARAVRMPGTTTAYLFGGYTTGGTTDTNDLYRVDYGGGALVFKKLTQTSAPQARELHGFGYDPKTATFVVFGGISSGASSALSDTWTAQITGDSATWTRVNGAGPSARYGFFFGTDEVAGRFIVYSGAQNPKGADPVNAAQDTWALDLRQSPPVWSQVLDGTEPNHAPGRRNGCFVVDPRGPSLYVFGGTADEMTTEVGLWGLDMRAGHEGWSLIKRDSEPPLRSSDFGFYDSVAGAVSCGFGNSSSGLYTDVATIGR